MIVRKLENSVIESLTTFQAVGIIGSRQVGKTTLVKEIIRKTQNAVYLDLELPSDQSKLEDPEFYFRSLKESLVVIDEIQRRPDLFPILRALIDDEELTKNFIILGSASPTLLRSSSESLAGRINYHELMPFSLEEIKSENNFTINDFWLKGGYPKSYLAKTESESLNWLNAFIQTFLERDIPQLGINIPAVQIRKFWTMLAHNQGQLWNASGLAKGLGISAPTVRNYLDILTDTFLVRQLQPFYKNVKKRLVKSPKVYLRDTGLLHSLLRINDFKELLAHPVVGFSWEGFVIEEIIKNFRNKFEYFFYRTAAGAEIDLVLSQGNQPQYLIEIKNSLSPKLSRSFSIAHQDFDELKTFVIYPGNENYKIRKNIEVISLADFFRLTI